jgi:membrane-bound acyltransferase YfiQ involved in biofilm formation
VSDTADRRAAREHEDEGERFDRELLELLNELRVAMPGVQVLFGFLLTVPFQQGFRRISDFQEHVYFVTLLLAATATAFLIAPTAYHRINFRMRQKPRVILVGSAQAIIGLVFLAFAMAGAVLLITDILFQKTTVAIVVAAFALLYASLWFGGPLALRTRGERAW